jgi:hypothetical protein
MLWFRNKVCPHPSKSSCIEGLVPRWWMQSLRGDWLWRLCLQQWVTPSWNCGMMALLGGGAYLGKEGHWGCVLEKRNSPPPQSSSWMPRAASSIPGSNYPWYCALCIYMCVHVYVCVCVQLSLGICKVLIPGHPILIGTKANGCSDSLYKIA